MPNAQGKTAGAATKRQTKPKPGRSQRTATVQAPIAKSVRVRNTGPVYRSVNHSGLRIKHREFIRDIKGSPDFAWDQVPINPGLAITFPWLAAIANRFESYQFHSLRFSFESTAPTTAIGSAMLAVDYDALDEGPNTKTTMMSYKGAARCATWDACDFVAERSDLHKLKSHYVRSGPVIPAEAYSAAADLKTYDVGQLFVATKGQVDEAEIGELYVEYDVEFSTPQLGDSISSLDIINSTGAGVVSNAFFGTPGQLVPVPAGTDGIKNTLLWEHVNASTVRFLQPGTFLIEMIAEANNYVNFSPTLQAGINFVKQIGSAVIGPAYGQSFANYVVKANAGEWLRVNGTVSGTSMSSRARITQVAAY